jgi:hypothetical protein
MITPGLQSCEREANGCINLPVRPVTTLAGNGVLLARAPNLARVAPGRPAGYACVSRRLYHG